MNAFDWIFGIILLGAGLLLITGNGDFIMGGAKGAAERKNMYDEAKMQKAFGIGFILMGAFNIVTIFVKSFAVSVIYLAAVVVIVVGEIWYVNKKCKK